MEMRLLETRGKNLADLHWRSSVLWKVELGSDEPGYLVEVISNKALKMQAGPCLFSQVHRWGGICLRTNKERYLKSQSPDLEETQMRL